MGILALQDRKVDQTQNPDEKSFGQDIESSLRKTELQYLATQMMALDLSSSILKTPY